MFSKHKLDAARIDFHNSFPPTRRSKTCERIEFPSGEYHLTYLHHIQFLSRRTRTSERENTKAWMATEC